MRVKAWSLRAQKAEEKKKIIFWNWYYSTEERIEH